MKKHTNKTHHRHNHLIPPSSLQHPPHLFNTNHSQPLHLIFKACFSPNHSTPIRNRKVTILTPTKSQSKYSTIIMILYACTNEKYLIPISVPILPHTTPQDRIIPHIISLHSTNILTVLYIQTTFNFLSLHTLPTPHRYHCLQLNLTPNIPSTTLQLYSSNFLYPANQTPTQTHLTSTSTHTTHHSLHHSNSYSLQSCHTTNTQIHKPHTNHKLSIII